MNVNTRKGLSLFSLSITKNFSKRFTTFRPETFNPYLFGSTSWKTSNSKQKTNNIEDTHRSHFERKLLPSSPQNLFNVVADVAKYKEFVPWVKESKILNRTESRMEAELVVGFSFLTERYTSLVELNPNKSIKVSVTSSNLFHYLNNLWEFEPGNTPNTCWTKFSVDFKFKSELHRTLTDMFFNEVQKTMLQAFQDRCLKLHPNGISFPFCVQTIQMIDLLPQDLRTLIFCYFTNTELLSICTLNKTWNKTSNKVWETRFKNHLLKHYVKSSFDFLFEESVSWKICLFYLESLPTYFVVDSVPFTEVQGPKLTSNSSSTKSFLVNKPLFPMEPLKGIKSRGVHYFEFTIHKLLHEFNTGIGIGINDISYNTFPGWRTPNDSKSYGYHSDDGSSRMCLDFRDNSKPPYGPTFDEGDTIGMGVDFDTNELFYTKNGVNLGVAFTNIPNNKSSCYPAIGIKAKSVVSFNFGETPFAFDLRAHLELYKTSADFL